MNPKNPTLLKTISALTLFFFTSTSLAWAVPGGIVIVPKSETPSFLQIEIPEDLASIEEIYEAPAQPDPKLILHIQNVHGNYETQMQIKKLLQYLHEKYAFKLMFAEGAVEKLNPEYLNLFPERERNLELADYLAKQGELTGIEYYLIDGPKDVEAVGIEKADLYRKNYEAFKKVYGARSEIDQFLNQFEQKLEMLSSRIFPQDTRRILSEWKKFEAGQRDFLPFVKRLAGEAKKITGLDLESLFAQVEWPQITRLLVLQSMEADLNRPQAETEKERLIEFLKSKRVPKEIVEAIGKLGAKHITMSRLDEKDKRLEDLPRYLLERLVETAGPKGFYFHDYPAFSLWAGYLILQAELDSRVLFEEIERVFQKVLDMLTVTELEKNLMELFRDAGLLRKLLHLELTRKEWDRVAYRTDWIQPKAIWGRLEKVNEEMGPGAALLNKDKGELKTSEVLSAFETALNFYQFARERESVFYETIQVEMAKRKIEKAVLVTGGFHTEGLMEIFRERQINYSILTPRLVQQIDNSNYISSMLENRPTMFDLGTIETIGLLQTTLTRLKQGITKGNLTLSEIETQKNYVTELTKEVQFLLEAYFRTGKFKDWKTARKSFNYFNKSLYSNDRRVELVYNEAEKAINIKSRGVYLTNRNEQGEPVFVKIPVTESKNVVSVSDHKESGHLLPNAIRERLQPPAPVATNESVQPAARSEVRTWWNPWSWGKEGETESPVSTPHKRESVKRSSVFDSLPPRVEETVIDTLRRASQSAYQEAQRFIVKLDSETQKEGHRLIGAGSLLARSAEFIETAQRRLLTPLPANDDAWLLSLFKGGAQQLFGSTTWAEEIGATAWKFFELARRSRSEARTGDPSAGPVLKSPEDFYRSEVRADEAGLKELIFQLQASDQEERIAAARALEELDLYTDKPHGSIQSSDLLDEVVTALVKAMEDKDARFRQKVAVTVGRLQGYGIHIFKRQAGETGTEYYARTVEELSRSEARNGDPSAGPVLKSPEDFYRSEVRISKKALISHLQALKNENEQARQRAERALARLAPQDFPLLSILIAAFTDTDTTAAARQVLKEAIRRIGPQAAPTLVKILRNRKLGQDVRGLALEILFQIGPRNRDVTLLKQILSGQESDLHSMAARALAKISSSSSVAALIEAAGSRFLTSRTLAVRGLLGSDLSNVRISQSNLWKLALLFKGRTPPEHPQVGVLFIRIGGPRVARILESYARNPRLPDVVRHHAEWALANLQHETFELEGDGKRALSTIVVEALRRQQIDPQRLIAVSYPFFGKSWSDVATPTSHGYKTAQDLNEIRDNVYLRQTVLPRSGRATVFYKGLPATVLRRSEARTEKTVSGKKSLEQQQFEAMILALRTAWKAFYGANSKAQRKGRIIKDVSSGTYDHRAGAIDQAKLGIKKLLALLHDDDEQLNVKTQIQDWLHQAERKATLYENNKPEFQKIKDLIPKLRFRSEVRHQTDGGQAQAEGSTQVVVPPLRVLVVDDEEMVRKITLMAIERSLGIQADSAEGGEEALQMMQQQPYNLVLSDIDMPEGNGLSLAKKAKELGLKAVIVLTTGRAQEHQEATKKLITSGAILKVLEKPYKNIFIMFPKLFDEVQSVLKIRKAKEQAVSLLETLPDSITVRDTKISLREFKEPGWLSVPDDFVAAQLSALVREIRDRLKGVEEDEQVKIALEVPQKLSNIAASLNASPRSEVRRIETAAAGTASVVVAPGVQARSGRLTPEQFSRSNLYDQAAAGDGASLVPGKTPAQIFQQLPPDIRKVTFGQPDNLARLARIGQLPIVLQLLALTQGIAALAQVPPAEAAGILVSYAELMTQNPYRDALQPAIAEFPEILTPSPESGLLVLVTGQIPTRATLEGIALLLTAKERQFLRLALPRGVITSDKQRQDLAALKEEIFGKIGIRFSIVELEKAETLSRIPHSVYNAMTEFGLNSYRNVSELKQGYVQWVDAGAARLLKIGEDLQAKRLNSNLESQAPADYSSLLLLGTVLAMLLSQGVEAVQLNQRIVNALEQQGDGSLEYAVTNSDVRGFAARFAQALRSALRLKSAA